MPKYRYECPVCQRIVLRYKRLANLDEEEYCVHLYVPDHPEQNVAYPMRRLFTASFQIIGRPQKDERENDLYGIITNGGDAGDRLKAMRKDAELMERDAASMPDAPKPYGTEEMLDSGLLQAARCGNSGLDKWCQEQIVEREYKEDEAITA